MESELLKKGIFAFLGIKGSTIINVKFKIEGREFNVYVQDDQYWGSIKDILLNREYEYLPEFELKNFKGLVVDIGAQVGLFSLISSIFAKKVIALEPHPVNYCLLRTNLDKNNITNVVAINKALWYKTGKIKIFEGTHSGGHSIYQQHTNKFFEVPTITLSDIIEEFGPIDLLKIDIEGAEFTIFEKIKKRTLQCINAIVGEFHLDYGDINSIIKRMKKAGFKLHIFYPPLQSQKNTYSIKVHDMLRLKLLKNFLYLASHLVNFKTKNLAIIFGLRV